MNTQVLAVVLGFLLSSCGLLREHVWDAPAKRDTLQTQLELLGRVKPEEVDSAIKKIEAGIGSEKELTPSRVRQIVQESLPPAMSGSMDTLWNDIKSEAGTIAPEDPNAKVRYLAAVRTCLAGISSDNSLYWLASDHKHTSTPKQPCAECIQARCARNELVARFVVRIQDYHEANYSDVFEGATSVGLFLDITTTISAALAAAVTPAGTKTFWATVAAVSSGTRLAASKNILNEKNASTVLNAMIKARTEKLAELWKGMDQDTTTFDMSKAKIGLTEYFNAGGLNKALAEMDAVTTEAKNRASDELGRARAAVRGSFSAKGDHAGAAGKARLSFNEVEVISNMRVTAVLVNGIALDAGTYEVVNRNGVLRVHFDAPPAENDKVEIYGECAEPGAHVASIEWE